MRRRRSPDPKYELDIRWSAEDRCYVVGVPELPGCMTHGRTTEQAVRRARQAIGAYVESLRARGLPVPTPLSERNFSGKIPLRIDPILHRDMAIRARIAGMSMNKYIEAALHERRRSSP